jgi:hypothetical protein
MRPLTAGRSEPRWARCFSFGNVCQAIDITELHFDHFSKRALKSLNNQPDFDSAIRRFDPSRPSQRTTDHP